jgi:hypothetical protein
MRRRRPEGALGPAHLAEFVVNAWPGGVSEAFQAWKDARRAWAAVHGWPGGEEARAVQEFDVATRLPDEEWSWHAEA